ncbi:hypothetical protein HRG_013676 [Hirsutella rhossiliensis]
MKLWDKDQNYTGEPYDLLDEKLRIFMSICYNIQVKPSQFHALFRESSPEEHKQERQEARTNMSHVVNSQAYNLQTS